MRPHTLSVPFVFLLLGFSSMMAQQALPFSAVTGFFEAFHKKDSAVLRTFFDPRAQLTFTSSDATGIPCKRHLSVSEFVERICEKPDKPVWEERLGDPVVESHENLATVWIPFSFYIDNTLSHSGHNLFQLFWNGSQWKILTIADTRIYSP